MNRTSIYSNNKISQLTDPVVITADETSAEVDNQGFDSLLLIGNIGLSADTLSGSVFIELEVQESDTSGSGFTAVADADLQNSVTGTNVGTFAVIDDPAEDKQRFITAYKGNKRFVRVVANLTGTHTNGTPISITSVQGNAEIRPVQ